MFYVAKHGSDWRATHTDPWSPNRQLTARRSEFLKYIEYIEWVTTMGDVILWRDRPTSNGGWKRSLIGIIQSRQRNWLGHIMRGDSLIRTIIEERMEEKKKRGRPRMMLLDRMMKEDYSTLKERAGHQGEWCHWTCLGRQRAKKRKKKEVTYLAFLFYGSSAQSFSVWKSAVISLHTHFYKHFEF